GCVQAQTVPMKVGIKSRTGFIFNRNSPNWHLIFFIFFQKFYKILGKHFVVLFTWMTFEKPSVIEFIVCFHPSRRTPRTAKVFHLVRTDTLGHLQVRYLLIRLE